MKIRLYSVRDAKCGFLAPIPCNSDAAAIRDFHSSVSSAKVDSLYFTNPADFSLYHVGTFDDESGQFDAILPEHLYDASSVFRSAEIDK